MSMLNDIWCDVRSLLYVRRCPVCGEPLPREGAVCTLCEVTAPLTGMWAQTDNILMQRLWGLLPVCHASALLWYVEGSRWRDAIHRFKYCGEWRTAYNLGRWYGSYLKGSGLYDSVDVVIPVPLHLRRLLWRGYNQSEYLAMGIARELGVKVDCRSVRRHRYNSSQTQKTALERWNNVEGIFSVVRAEALKGRHVLLVDDVFTTGATIISLANAIAAASENVTFSIAVLATSRHGVGAAQ